MAKILVEMGDLETGYSQDTLTTLGLGSCVGLVIYDLKNKIGGLAHIMLPTSKYSSNKVINKTALIAEKDNITRLTFKKILESNDFKEILETEEKENTLINCKISKPSIIYLSEALPPTNGLDTLQEIAKINNEATTIMLSQAIEKSTISNYISAGAHDVIIKPFTEEKIIAATNYALQKNSLKYADIAIKVLLQKMITMGAQQNNLIAKMAGGAHMFPTLMDEESMNIGKQNVDAIKKELNEIGIKLISEETGANIGRTIIFEVETGKLKIKTKDGFREI